MPAYCTHYVFACETEKEIKDLTNIELNREAIMLGTQGPDVFFFHRIAPWMIGKPLRKVGSALHRAKAGDILDAFAAYCKTSSQKDIALSYAYGFILHYALDRKCHPFVYSLQNKLKEKGSPLHPSSIHNIIEMSMDSVILNSKLNIKKPSCFNTAITVPDSALVLFECGNELAYAVNIVTDIKVTQTDCVTAFEDTKTAQGILHDEYGNKKVAVGAIENLVAPLTGNFKVTSMLRPDDIDKAKKFGNFNNGFWESPYESGKRNESFIDLYELAKQDAIELIDGFNHIMSGDTTGYEITKNKSFLTGVEVK